MRDDYNYNAPFHENEIVLLDKRPDFFHDPPVGQYHIGVCISMSVAIEKQYKTCSYLFRCLSSLSQDPYHVSHCNSHFDNQFKQAR